ncbi:MAG: HlyD family type I secretion periplasmic adaptor subunit [Alphaproteobacteria bacterium CG_4_9_14_3_um_filter_47_13]|nr:MAG: HlyD family type I secretion periplasmic adaptor subunit [Alphaproteobacteria bacterium CG_4_9_14_3_um_filter_47_13]
MMTADTEFMSELEAAVRLKPHVAANIFLLVIVSLVLFFLVWANFSWVEEMTRGSGQVVPTQEIQVVQSLEGGILAALLVNEGDRVEKDQALLRISDVAFSSEERGTEAKSLGLRAKKARLTAEANGTEFSLPADISRDIPQISANEKALYDSRQKELENAKSIFENKINSAQAQLAETGAEIKRIKDNRGLLYQQLEITRKMVEQRAVPKLEEIKLQRELSDLSGQLKANEEKIIGLEAELRGAKKEREDQDDKFRSQALGELNEVETQIRQIDESLKTMGDRVFRTELRAPVSGIVNKIAVKTIGGVIEPAHKLIEIVPVDDELKIIAKVRPSDIAFLKPGQEVNVKISAYDATIYGQLKGTLIRIGANNVTDRDGNVFFEIEVRTVKNYLGTEDHKLPITPGMVAETQIVTGKRTIMTYLLKPLLRARANALRER